jgi:hypothetical protein
MKQISLVPKWPLSLLCLGVFMLASCKKDNNTNTGANSDPSLMVEAAENNNNAVYQFNDVFNIALGVQDADAGENIGLGTGNNIIYRTGGANSPDSVSRCFTVTVVPKVLHQFPKTVTIDFGNGCVGKDGKLRSGKLITVFTGPMIVPGSKATTTFDNYNVDSFKIEGTHIAQNTSSSNLFGWEVNVTDGKITNTVTGKWITWNSVLDYKLIEGNGSPFYSLDNVLQITGNAQGSSSNGNSWTAEITDPVIRKIICGWPGQGKITFTQNSSAKNAVLDYGDGSCDNKATITINGVSYNIVL